MYTYFFAGTLAICSEIKGLLELPRAKGVAINPFPPGHMQSYDIDSQGLASLVETKRFLLIGGCDPSTVVNLAPKDPHANIRMLLKKAVQKRLLADRRIGCLLSGGLDSSLIAALLVQCMKEQGVKYK
jgi:asparagine synthase (glutamine-hydrolysing)